jgi:phenylacetate-CoA ligase
MIRRALAIRRMLKNQQLPAGKLEALRTKKLRAVIRNAYDHVPYYRSLFRQAGLSPDDIRSVEDLKKVPITTKDDVRAAGPREMVADWAHLPSLVSDRTSGSTGEPMTVYRSKYELMIGGALHFASLVSLGLRSTDRLATLGHTFTIPQWLPRRFRMYESRVIPSDVPMDEQIRQLKEFQPTVIHTYPSVLGSLIHNLGCPLRDLIRPRIIITGAEVFEEVLRTRVSAHLDAEFFNVYGAVELGRLAWECPTHEGLHLNADHFILECLEDEESAGLEGAAVAYVTSLYAFAMPFVRYRLGDLTRFLNGRCSCGRSLPLIAPPLGRDNEILSLPSGKMLSPIGFGRILREIPGLNQFRVIQERRDHVVVKVVLANEPDDAVRRQIKEQCLAYIGEPVRLDVQVVEYIRDGPKFRYVVTKVPRPDAKPVHETVR